MTDFGLAKKVDETGQTASGAITGTPSYMAPEQAGGHSKEVGPAADVWAGTIVGQCTIYVSPAMWVAAMLGDRGDQYSVCIAFAHEYGHTLGLADTETIPMMGASDWSRRDDPLCEQLVYGWRGSSHPDHEWLAANHLARFHFRGLLIRRAHRS